MSSKLISIGGKSFARTEWGESLSTRIESSLLFCPSGSFWYYHDDPAEDIFYQVTMPNLCPY